MTESGFDEITVEEDSSSRRRWVTWLTVGGVVVALALLMAVFAGRFGEVDSAGATRLRVAAGSESIPLLAKALVDAGIEIKEISPARSSLEDFFIEKTGGGAAE